MPSLNWDSKHIHEPQPGRLILDSLIYPRGAGYPRADPQGQVVLGDNLAVMASLRSEYEQKINLIYADPPFFTNRSYPARIGRGEDSRRPQEWQLTEGYPDHWSDIDAYLDMLYPRLVAMHRLLAPTGTLYLHLDWHANAYARLLLDEIFGPERLLNEIVWVYHGPSPIRSAFNRKHDTLLVYTKGQEYTFNVDDVRQPYDPSTVKTFASSPKAGFGKVPDLERGKVPEDWWYFPVVARLHTERTGYPTQKPEALLERILLASSNPGDLVADFFCGSGTTPVVAARTGRRFLAVDGAWRAIHTSLSRLAEGAETPFQFLRDDGFQFSWQAGSPDLAKWQDTGITLSSEALRDLDYWEVDPAWDGKIFRSAAQACRPRRKGKIPAHLDLSGFHLHPSNRPAAIRLVTVQGACQQVVLSPRTATG